VRSGVKPDRAQGAVAAAEREQAGRHRAAREASEESGVVKSLHERKIKKHARAVLEEREEVRAAFVARSRGWTQSVAGWMGVGAARQGRAYGAAKPAGFGLASPIDRLRRLAEMALAITQWRLMALRIGSPIGLRIGGRARELVGAARLADVHVLDVKRLVLGQVIRIGVQAAPFELEANAPAGAKPLADAVGHARAAHSPPAREAAR
jgi:hypothetical protein